MKRLFLLATAFSLTAFFACDQLGDPSGPLPDQKHEFEIEPDETAEAQALERAHIERVRSELAKRRVRMNKRFNSQREYGIQAKLSVGAGEDYTTIQDAIDAASPGDKIKVKESLSPYEEEIVIDVPGVRLTAEGDVTIEGRITVIADEVTIDNFRVEYDDDDEFVIHLDGVSDCEVKDNYVVGGSDGIRLDDSSDCLIKDNTATGADGDGIELCNSDNNDVQENYCFGNGDDGIEIDESDNNEIKGNTCTGNVDGIDLPNGDPDDPDISTGNEIEDNNCDDNTETGIEIGGASHHNVIGSDNTARNHPDYGIELENDTHDNLVKKNDFSNNTPCGILDEGTDNELKKNDTNCVDNTDMAGPEI